MSRIAVTRRGPSMPHEAMALASIFGILALCHFGAAHIKFPDGFTFGVATAAHQIEGAWNVSGKSENVWDRLSHTRPEMIADGTNGDIACDSYHRYLEDVEELAYLGVDFYRLSLSWARILPTGRVDHINEDGVRYYNDLLDALAQKNIEPLFGWFAHPIFTVEGGYPAVMVNNVARQSEAEGLPKSRLEQFDDYWINRIKGTSDFLGINHYTTHIITAAGVDPIAKSPSWLKDIGAVTTMEVGEDSASEWLRVVPKGFANLLRWCKSSYNNPPIYITENGVSDRGTLEDYGRIKFFNDYLSAILEVIYEDGVNVLGYTAWTLMDNFEWRAGFSERFGFYYVDITDPARPRTPKLSVEYYRQLTATRELPQDDRFKDPAIYKTEL
ncbi:myrosinase 1-like isoform X3 [Cydia amplana]|uniref:myrosinase 1-like isoform X3 n=1 Tax=Cydia amplana TaxID=1869771 RepID=UPI002FE638DC